MVSQISGFVQRRFWLIALFILLTAFTAEVAVGRTDLFVTSYYSPLYATVPYSMAGESVITQQFQARYPGLNRIELFVSKLGLDADARLVFHLKDSCNAAADLATVTVDFARLPAEGLYAFKFPVIDNSRGRQFCVSANTEMLDAPAALYVYATATDVYRPGAANYFPDNRPRLSAENKNSQAKYFVWLPMVQKSEEPARPAHNFDVGFRLNYNGSTQATLMALADYLAAHKPFPLGAPAFYVFMGFIYAGGLIILWRLVINLKSGPGL